MSIHRLVFRTPGLTPAERCLALYVLGRVRRRPRPLNAVDLAKATGIGRDTLPRYTRKLEAAGLIRRSRKRLGGPITYEMAQEVYGNAA